MRPDLSPRLLALPPDDRATLAGVDGPGWEITRGAYLGGAYGPASIRPLARCGAEVSDRYSWWPASPAASVAAVLRISITEAYERMATRMRDGFVICVDDPRPDDSSAALSIIEAHVANRSPA